MSTRTNNRGFIFIVSGPSGSGKTTLVKALLKSRQFRQSMVKSISLTTRPPRSAEKEGRDYFFVGRDEFFRLRRAKKILEWTKYLEYYYGTPRDFVEECLRGGKHLLMCLDLKGAVLMKKAYPDRSVTIFVKPPSLEVLRERIRGRCVKTSDDEIHSRLTKAQKEMRSCDKYDYCVINNDLTHAVRALKDIIYEIVGDGKGRVS